MENAPFHAARVERDGTATVVGSASSRFPWWSFTKTALAICALRLVEEGLILRQCCLPLSRSCDTGNRRHLHARQQRKPRGIRSHTPCPANIRGLAIASPAKRKKALPA